MKIQTAQSPEEIEACLRLRAQVLVHEAGLGTPSESGDTEQDEYESAFDHLMLIDDSKLIGTCRTALMDKETLVSSRSYLGTKLYDLRGMRPSAQNITVVSRLGIVESHRTAAALGELFAFIWNRSLESGKSMVLASLSYATPDRDDGWRLFRTLRDRELLHPTYLFPPQKLASCGSPAREMLPEIQGVLPLTGLHEICISLGGRFGSLPAYHSEYGGGSVELLAVFESEQAEQS